MTINRIKNGGYSMDNLICASCGSSVSADAKFCLSCGADLERARKEAEKPKNLCSECGAELAQGQLFCHLCGKKQEESCEAACEKPVSVKRTALGWIRRSLTLLMAILFIALAFLPIVSYRTTIDDEKVGFSFSAIALSILAESKTPPNVHNLFT